MTIQTLTWPTKAEAQSPSTHFTCKISWWPGKGRGSQEGTGKTYVWVLWVVQQAAAASKSLQSCPTPRDPMDSSPPGSSVHGIFQARVLEWGAITFSEYSNRNEHFGTTHCTACFMLVSSLTSQSFNGCALLSPFYRWRHQGTGR